MEVRLFGELEAVAAGVPVPVRGAKQRALLALLALQRGRPVSAGRLIDVLWGDGLAANPANALQAQIGQLPDSGWPPTASSSRRRPLWARPSGCGAASRWPNLLRPAFLLPNEPIWTS